jgi:microcystin-dependent protein
MSVFNWSQTADNNATADLTINWQEGQAPSTINDSARAMMAALAKYRDDITGAIVTSGTATAYTLSTFSQFDTPAHLNGQIVAFTPHATNGPGPVTLSVDSLGAKPLRSAPNMELQSGVLIQGTPYVALYNNTDGAFYLQGNAGSTYGIPLGASLDFWLPTAPSSAFVFPVGQAISRTTYSALFAAVGTTYGAGDGTTTFNLPDLRGRVVASPDNMGGIDIGRLSASGSMASVRNALGGSGGASAITLSTENLPPYTPSGSNGAVNVTVSSTSGDFARVTGGNPGFSGSAQEGMTPSTVTSTGTVSGQVFTGNPQGGKSAAVDNMQPAILANRIMRII